MERISQKAEKNRLILRPHFKTHQSSDIGKWFTDFGVGRISVSSLSMAGYFTSNGWKDITVAIPLNLLEIDTVNKLSKKIRLGLTVESPEVIRILGKNLAGNVSVFIKIDSGYHRTGIDPSDNNRIEAIIKKIESSSRMVFAGFLTHAGNSYKAKDLKGVKKVHEESRKIIEDLGRKYKDRYPGIVMSYGDTPTVSACDNFVGIDELRPGNFIFYDLVQWNLGICSFEQIAVALAVPVIAKNSGRSEIVVYGGAVNLSKEKLFDPSGRWIYGYPVKLSDSGWELPDQNSFVYSLSQEHGLVKCSREFFSSVSVGDLIGIIPVHSCLTANLSDHFLTTEGTILNKSRS